MALQRRSSSVEDIASGQAESPARSGLANAVLNGCGKERVEDLGERWARSCIERKECVNEGRALVLECAGLDPDQSVCRRVMEADDDACKIAISALARKVIEGTVDCPEPPKGTLATLSPALARQVADKLRLFFMSAAIVLAAAGADNASAPLAAFLTWLPFLASSAIRPLRLSATAAGVGIAVALVRENSVARAVAASLSRQLAEALADEPNGSAMPSHSQSHKVARLSASKTAAEKLVTSLSSAATALVSTMLVPRFRDVAEIVRRIAAEVIGDLAREDPEIYKASPWPERVLRMVCDPGPDVRLAALAIISSWYARDPAKPAAHREHKSRSKSTADVKPGSSPAPAQDALLPRIASLLAERARDVEPRVATAAVRCLRHPRLAAQLSDKDFSAIVELSFAGPETHSSSRAEAALFMDEHLLVEPGLGAAKAAAAAEEEVTQEAKVRNKDGDDVGNHFNAEQGLSLLSNFLAHYATPKRLSLTPRLVGALWGRAPCLSRWNSMAELALLGESRSGVGCIKPLSTGQRAALLATMVSAFNCAADDEDAVGLAEAAAALIPRLPRLLEVCSAEEVTLVSVASLAKLLIQHVCDETTRCDHQGTFSIPRALIPALRCALRAVSELRPRPLPSKAMLSLVDALLALSKKNREAQALVSEMVTELTEKLGNILCNHVGADSNALQAESTTDVIVLATPLAALCGRGAEVGLRADALFECILGILDKATAKICSVTPDITHSLLELAVPLLLWRLRGAWLAPAAQDSLKPNNFERRFRSTCSRLAVAATGCAAVQCHAVCSYLAVLEGFPAPTGSCTTSEENKADSIAAVIPDEAHALATIVEQLTQNITENPASLKSTASFLDNGHIIEVGDDSPMAFGPMVSARWGLEKAAMIPAKGSECCQTEGLLWALTTVKAIAESHHEAIFAGEPGSAVVLLLSMKGLPQSVQDASKGLVRRLYKLSHCSRGDATRTFSLFFTVIARACFSIDRTSGTRLSELLASSVEHLPAAGSPATLRMSSGLAKALREVVSMCASRGEASISTLLLPFVSPGGPASVLTAFAARKLAKELSSDVKFAARERVLIVALQARGSVGESACGRQRKNLIKARLKGGFNIWRRAPAHASRGPTTEVGAATGWLVKPRIESEHQAGLFLRKRRLRPYQCRTSEHRDASAPPPADGGATRAAGSPRSGFSGPVVVMRAVSAAPAPKRSATSLAPADAGSGIQAEGPGCEGHLQMPPSKRRRLRQLAAASVEAAAKSTAPVAAFSVPKASTPIQQPCDQPPRRLWRLRAPGAAGM